MFNVSIVNDGVKIVGELIIDSYFFEPSKYDYAFYLYKDNEIVDKEWYSENKKVDFDLRGHGIYYIKVFIRDIEYDNKRTFISEKITTIVSSK